MNSTNLGNVLEQAAERDGPGTLQRTLTASQLILLGVGAIIGAGIFVATGTVAAADAGPAIVLSFLIAAAGCLCAGLCYAEFAALVPVAGSAYSYVYATFGRLAGWMIGWCLLLEYSMAGANVAVGWSAYLSGLVRSLGISLPVQLTTPPFIRTAGHLASSGATFNAPAFLLVLTLAALLLGGVRLSVRTNAALVLVKLVIIVLFIVCGAWYVDSQNWHPFIPPNAGHFGEFGWSGVIRGAGAIFYAYLGFDAVSTAARESRDPQRTVPRGIIGALALCTVLYIAFSLVLTGLAPYQVLGVPNPASVALDYAGPQLHFLKVAVEIGAVLGLTSVVLALLYGQSRILYAMSRDRVVPSLFGRIGARSAIPYASVLGSGIVAATAAGFLPTEVLGEMISIGTLSAFVVVCAGVLVLRVRRPDLARPFRTPAAPLVCTAGILICGYLMAALPAETWRRFLIWLAAGAAIYVIYGRRRAAADKRRMQ